MALAKATGCGLSFGVLAPAKSAFLGLPVAKTTNEAAVSLAANNHRSVGRVAASAPPAAKTTRKPRGIMVAKPVSPEMQDFVGVSEISRTQAMKLIWDYIKANNLQVLHLYVFLILTEKYEFATLLVLRI